MSVPAGWQILETGLVLPDLETHFTDHVGPLYVREGTFGRQIGFEVKPHMCNPAGICHGGMLMTVMDIGLAFILHGAMGEHRFTPSVSFNFDFLAPGQIGDFLVCEGQCNRHTKRTGFVSGRLVGRDGPVIAGSGIFKITDVTFKTADG